MLFFPIAIARYPQKIIPSVNKKLSYLSIFVLILGTLVACQPALIEIETVAKRRKGKVVYLAGTVGQVAPFLDNSAYQLQDNTGSVWVVTEKTAPAVGRSLYIKGKIQYQSLPFGDRELGDFYVIELEQLDFPPEK